MCRKTIDWPPTSSYYFVAPLHLLGKFDTSAVDGTLPHHIDAANIKRSLHHDQKYSTKHDYQPKMNGRYFSIIRSPKQQTAFRFVLLLNAIRPNDSLQTANACVENAHKAHTRCNVMDIDSGYCVCVWQYQKIKSKKGVKEKRCHYRIQTSGYLFEIGLDCILHKPNLDWKPTLEHRSQWATTSSENAR